MQDVIAEVVENAHISKSYCLLSLKTGWSGFDPGQFVMLKIPSNEVFVRRPFSIALSSDDDTIDICYKIVGPGTKKLSTLTPGDKIKVLGPSGRGYSIPKKLKEAVLVAGGFGVAPFVGLSKQLAAKGVETTLFYGGKTMEDILFLDHFEGLGVESKIATEDGSLGHKGMITELLLKLQDKPLNNNIIYCCGPDGLIKAVVDFAKRYRVPAEVSYETYMGCGIGVCLGCVVETKDGYKRACKEGPVFDIEDVL